MINFRIDGTAKIPDTKSDKNACDKDDKYPIRKNVVYGRRISAASAAEEIEFGSNKYYLMCGLGGIVSCGSTHALLTPLDLIKCRLQVNPEKYKSIGHGFKITYAEDGMRGLVRGWSPTLLGYSSQGMFKFGLYEYFKVQYTKIASPETAYTYRTLIYLGASASAEFFADMALSPFEAAKVRIQTSENYATTLRAALPRMLGEEGFGTLYKGIVPLWGRQIPYTMMKFASFEACVELLYEHAVPKPREQCSKAEQLVVTFAAGYIAGVFCAVVSHPADTIVSKLNQDKTATVGSIFNKLGFAGVWKGLIARIIMVGTLTALQWFVYDGFKVYMSLPRPPPAVKPEPSKKDTNQMKKK